MPAHKQLPLIQRVLSQHADQLPKLGKLVVILPNSGACQQFRLQLLQQLPDTQRALIPPQCLTLREWLQATLPPAAAAPVSTQARRLLFMEALSEHSTLFNRHNRWQICDALLQLFDELTLQQSELPADQQQWTAFLQQAYQADALPAHLSFEARLVHTLWQAWQQQLDASQQLDATRHYALQLAQLAQQADDCLRETEHIYIAAQAFSTAEQRAVDAMLATGKATLVDCDSHVFDCPAGEFVRQCYADTPPIRERARQYQLSQPPAISVYACGDDEREVAAMDLQIRKWLLDGKNNIGVICEDRRVARRLRALLERSHIPLQDIAGWSLATTSAAAVLERWLECIEQDFDHQPFLDLLKSRFIKLADDEDSYLQGVYRFEKDIVKHENVFSNLERYRAQLQQRKQRLQEKLNWRSEHYEQIQQCLQQLQTISQPLRELYRQSGAAPASTFHDSLIASLDALGIGERLQQDAAGQNVLQCLQEMQASLLTADPEMDWRDYRIWLGSALEGKLFRPWRGDSPVKLMTLEQSACQSFQAVILASVNAGAYPGSPAGAPVFNQSVRQSLGLLDWRQQKQQKLRQFQQALLSADEVLITCKNSDKGEPLPPSPWVEALLHFYQRVFGEPAINQQLDDELDALVAHRHRQQTGITQSTQPQPAIEAGDLPQRLSAGGHQRLINCPYQFFAADALGLRAADEISRELQKSDYGERVHTILQAFHTQLGKLPPPFPEPVTEANREAAIDHLQRLSEIVFRGDIQQNILHKSWLSRWQKHIPAYIDWQIKRHVDWRVAQCEIDAETRLDEQVSLHGRLDRIDRHIDTGEVSIIDYKTGNAPRQDEVDCGENVQLASYSLLQAGTREVLYLSLDAKGDSVKTASSLSEDSLQQISEKVGARLKDMIEKLKHHHPMPAWGDEAVCQYCDFRGVCRKPHWSDN